ncbi:DUF1700 domain-containing protein [Blautia intestinalis]|uniref:DUF1700 domain-containing protein n=1 Tax=Blautia intestinalis TaxID=2763028 RepID=UPI0022E0372A|nr:DUF1700 domain-containing protein [Blautia intestinalis]
MSKTEFLDILYNQLSGQMPEGSVAAHVQYYRNYIEDEQQKGHTETDILNDLGDPRLIARTLLDTEVGAGNPQNGSTYSAIYNEADSDYNEYDSSDSARGHVKKHSFKLDLSTWYGKVAVILIAAVVLLLLVTILGILIPVVIVAGVIMYIVSQFRKQ